MNYYYNIIIKILIIIIVSGIMPSNPEIFESSVVEYKLPTLTTGFITDYSVFENIMIEDLILEEGIFEEENERILLYNDLDDKFAEASSINDEVVGWIYIPYSNIDYPILFKEEDNDFYLSHNLHKEKSRDGSIFLDASSGGYLLKELSDTDGISLVQGHSMSTGTMFKDILKYKIQDWAEEHSVVYIYTQGQLLKYKIFSSMLLNADIDGIRIEFSSMVDRLEHYDTLYEQSIVDLDKYENPLDILVLSTCSYESDNIRCVVYASRIE